MTNKLPKTIANIEYTAQLIRSSSSPGSNYIEAVEALSKKDFIYRLKICRKETKEPIHWLRLVYDSNKNPALDIKKEFQSLVSEGREILKILTSSILTSEGKKKPKRVIR